MTFRRMFATIRAMPPGTRVRDTGTTARDAITPRDTGMEPAPHAPRHATYIKPAAAWWTHHEDLECLT